MDLSRRAILDTDAGTEQDLPSEYHWPDDVYDELAGALQADSTIRNDPVTGALVGNGRFGTRMFPAHYLDWLDNASNEGDLVVFETLPTLENVVFEGFSLPFVRSSPITEGSDGSGSPRLDADHQMPQRSRLAYKGGWKPRTTMRAILTIVSGARVGDCRHAAATYYVRSGVLEMGRDCNHRMLAHVLTGERSWELSVHVRKERIEPPAHLAEHIDLASNVLRKGSGFISNGSDEWLMRQAGALRSFSNAKPTSEELSTLLAFLDYYFGVRHEIFSQSLGWWTDPRWKNIYLDSRSKTASNPEILLRMLNDLRELRQRTFLHNTLLSLYRKLGGSTRRSAFETWFFRLAVKSMLAAHSHGRVAFFTTPTKNTLADFTPAAVYSTMSRSVRVADRGSWCNYAARPFSPEYLFPL